MSGARPISLETVPINRGGGCAIGADALRFGFESLRKFLVSILYAAGNKYAQNNELLALYARLKGAPERERRAIERKIDGVLGTGTPSADALERHTITVAL